MVSTRAILIIALSVTMCAGCGKHDDGSAHQQAAPAGAEAGVTDADLLAEVTVPHLRVTVKSIWQRRDGLVFTLRIEPAGGLGPVSVHAMSFYMALSRGLIRTRGGEPVLFKWPPDATFVDIMGFAPIPNGGWDIELYLSDFAQDVVRLQRWKSMASGPSYLKPGTELRYFLWRYQDCLGEKWAGGVPMVGAGVVTFGEGKGAQTPGREVEASDLRREITVPHLWATVEAMSSGKSGTTCTLLIQGSNGLGPVRVLRSDLDGALAEMALRTKDGNPAGELYAVHYHPAVPPPASGNYVTVGEDGVRITVTPYGPGPLLEWKSTGKDQSVVTGNPWLRYYMCSAVFCRSEDKRKGFFVPLLGVGLVKYGGEEEWVALWASGVAPAGHRNALQGKAYEGQFVDAERQYENYDEHGPAGNRTLLRHTEGGAENLTYHECNAANELTLTQEGMGPPFGALWGHCLRLRGIPGYALSGCIWSSA